MKGEETRQRRKEGRAKNPERSKQRAKHKARHNESRAPTREMVEEELLPPVIPEKRLPEKKPPMPKPGDESSFSITLQVLFPYLLAGLGMVLAGMVLDVVQMYIPQGTAPEERTSS